MKFLALPLLIYLIQGCITRSPEGIYSGSFQSAYKDIDAKLSLGKVSFESIKNHGPFEILESKNLILSLDNNESIIYDYARPKNDENSPIIIFHHGNKYIKEAHWDQARHAASWGFHAITVQSKNEYNWVKNGRRLHSLVKIISSTPSVISPRIMTSNIILAGHSFGGSAVTIASSLSKNVKGVILLDPAVVSNSVLRYQKNNRSNAVLLGADTSIFLSRKRSSFYKNMKNLGIELSVRGSTHNDAQNPTITEHLFGNDPTTTSHCIETFTHLITASAFMLSQPSHKDDFKAFLSRYEKSKILSYLKIKEGALANNSFERDEGEEENLIDLISAH